MKNSNDLILLEKSIEHSALIFELCKQLPDYEATMIHFLKESTINLSTYLNQVLHSNSNDESLYYIDNARGLLYRIKTMLNISLVLKYIERKDVYEFNNQLDSMIDLTDKKKGLLEEEVEKERLNLSFCLPDMLESFKLPGGKRFDS